MRYRAEIDGLRALAVVPVILFHAGFEYFSGGYVGVDVFFVISGFLITSIIITDLQSGTFSIVDFYERRARRILPALFFVISACLPFAWLWLTPASLQTFAQSLVAVATFSSNVLFWLQSGYFAPAAELKPLLHTWSLAVEEQYYVIFPILLMTLWRLGRRLVIGLLIALFFVSLGLAHWAVSRDPSGAFYLLPTRGWELLLGASAALYLTYATHLQSRSANQILSLTGLGMIIYAVAAFDQATAFPGLPALVPTVGTVLLILCAIPGTVVHAVLTLRPVVGIGLISYSAYLWHQPLLAFARHRLFGEECPSLFAVICLASLVLAWFSYRFVESPFRNTQRFDQASVFAFSAAGLAIILVVGIIGHRTNGFETLKMLSYSEEERKTYVINRQSTSYDIYNQMYSSECKFWAKEPADLPAKSLQRCSSVLGSPLVILGDSHALNIFNIVAKSNRFPFVIGISQGYCRPHTPRDGCHYESSVEFLAEISQFDPTVVYHQAGSYFLTDSDGNHQPSFGGDVFYDRENVERVAQYLSRLSALSIDVVWLGPFAEYRIDPALRPTVIEAFPSQNLSIFKNLEQNILRTLGDDYVFRYIGFNEIYEIKEEVVVDDCLIWRDQDHFSSCGENYLSQNGDWGSLK